MAVKRSAALMVAGVLVVGGGVLAAVLLGGGPDEPSARPAGDEPVRAVGLGPQGAELGRLLQQGKTQTFHASYRAVSDDELAKGQELSMELWRKGARERVDVQVSVGGQSARTASFVLPDRSVGCRREGDGGPWTCQRIERPASSGPDALIAEIAREVEGRSVEVRDETVAGRPVRCFTIPLESNPGEVCMTAAGIPARVKAGPSRIELQAVTTSVPDSSFEPPAKVTG